MECHDARHLIPSYLDGELSEAQAGPLRKHLLDCQPCRGTAQGVKNLKRWFVEPKPITIPSDFSARVARRAFAGDTGERYAVPVAAGSFPSGQDGQLRFVLQLTAVAAAILIFLSIALSRVNLPSESRLMADDHPEVSLDRALDELDQMNHGAARASLPVAKESPAASRTKAVARPAAGRTP